MQIFKEAVIAQFNRMAGIQRYNRTDFDKWLADYDVSGVFVFDPNISFPVGEIRQHVFRTNLPQIVCSGGPKLHGLGYD